jgi:hypothetical protein
MLRHILEEWKRLSTRQIEANLRSFYQKEQKIKFIEHHL